MARFYVYNANLGEWRTEHERSWSPYFSSAHPFGSAPLAREVVRTEGRDRNFIVLKLVT